MEQYLDLLQNIVDNGVEKESGRANMPNTIGISHAVIKMDLQEGFPLLTTKKMYWKGIVHELLWFLRGETNIKYLVDNNVNIWNNDCYRWYLKKLKDCYPFPSNLETTEPLLSKEQFIELIKKINTSEFKNGTYWRNDEIFYDFKEPIEKELEIQLRTLMVRCGYTLGDLGKVYGYQWRNQNGVDQIKEVLDGLKTNPYSRYHIIDGWNKADFKDMALPPCHLLYQFIVRPMTIDERLQYKENLHKGENPGFELGRSDEYYTSYCDNWGIPKYYLDLNMYQRSCDTMLGVPFNIASMSLLLMLFAKANNMIAGVSTWIGGDTHLYVNHIDAVNEQLERYPYDLPRMVINKELNSLEDMLALTIDDFELQNYEHHPAIKAELFTGLKK